MVGWLVGKGDDDDASYIDDVPGPKLNGQCKWTMGNECIVRK